MTTIHFTGTIVGGPNDGKKMTYNGTSEKSEAEVLTQMDKIHLDGHTYKIIEFDKQKMHAVLMW